MGCRTQRLGPLTLVCGSVIALAACSGGSTGAGSSWQSVSSLPPSLGGALSSITVQGSTFFAAGYRGVRGPGLVWSSTDGRAWTAAPELALATSPLRAVTTGPKGILALGNDCSGGGECGLDHSQSYLSADGTTWTAGGEVSGSLQRAGDGSTWQAAPANSGLDAANLSRIVALGSEVIALGTSTGGDSAAWVSSDGATWARLATGSAFASAQITAVSEVDGRYLLLGQTATGSPVGALVAP